MPAMSMLLLADATNVTPSSGGTEFPSGLARRQAYLFGAGFARVQYEVGANASLAMRVEYSMDGGASWQTLVQGPDVQNNVAVASDWVGTPSDLAGTDMDVLLRAVAVGSGGGKSVKYVELLYR